MSIRTSIYDFFGYVIPGGLMILALLGALALFGYQDLWIQVYNSNFSEFLAVVICAYITGHVVNPLISKWSKFFEPAVMEKTTLEEFKAKHPNLVIDIVASDWALWFSSIRRENMELAHEIDRQKATAILLRGISFFMQVSVVIVLAGVIAGKLIWWFLFSIPVLVLLAYIVMRESIKFNKWFYYMIYELVTSRKEPFLFEKPK